MIPLDTETAYQEGCRLFFRRVHPDESRERAREIFLEILRHDPEHHRSHNMLGLCREAEGDREAARNSFRAAISLSSRAVYHLNLGISLANDELWADALTSLENACRIDPGDPAINFNLGMALHALGRHEDAALAWRRSLERDPGREGIHLALGLALLEQGRTDAAEEVLAMGVERHQADREIRRALAALYEETGRPRAAAKLWEDYLRRTPPEPGDGLEYIRGERDRLRALAREAAGAAPPSAGKTRRKAT